MILSILNCLQWKAKKRLIWEKERKINDWQVVSVVWCNDMNLLFTFTDPDPAPSAYPSPFLSNSEELERWKGREQAMHRENIRKSDGRSMGHWDEGKVILDRRGAEEEDSSSAWTGFSDFGFAVYFFYDRRRPWLLRGYWCVVNDWLDIDLLPCSIRTFMIEGVLVLP